MDIYICETNEHNSERLREICIGYSIRENIDSHIKKIEGIKELKKKVENSLMLNIFMLGIEQDIGEFAEYIRACNEKNYIILLGMESKKIFDCITPSLRPSGIIIRPVEGERIELILNEIRQDYIALEEVNEQFVFNIQASKYMVPCNKILYFESSSRKIVLRSKSQEFEFYGSLEKISKELPESFIRVHRSYIVNTEKISEIDFSENTIYFEDNTFAFFSRSHKTVLKEYLEKKK